MQLNTLYLKPSDFCILPTNCFLFPLNDLSNYSRERLILLNDSLPLSNDFLFLSSKSLFFSNGLCFLLDGKLFLSLMMNKTDFLYLSPFYGNYTNMLCAYI